MDAATHERITQFENMATADPNNDMAHFSLGSAYLQAGRATDAAASLERCITLNPEMSKAYERCAQAMISSGWEDRAADVLRRGYTIAASRGDRMPMEAMGGMLDDLGLPRPNVSTEGSVSASGESTMLEAPPFKGPVGEWIAANIAAARWDAWIHQGTKVINELRLDLSRPEDSAMYDQHMREYLDIPEDIQDA